MRQLVAFCELRPPEMIMLAKDKSELRTLPWPTAFENIHINCRVTAPSLNVNGAKPPKLPSLKSNEVNF